MTDVRMALGELLEKGSDADLLREMVGAILLEQNDEYAIQKRYMSLESLAAMSGHPPIRLPAIAGA